MPSALRVIFTVLALITSPTLAFAECAWVLWSLSILPLPETYRVDQAHPTRRECVEKVHIFAALLKKEGYTMRAEGGPEAIGQKGSEMVRYFCLPDTVDPRGPKGK